jgi:hypothetical protein
VRRRVLATGFCELGGGGLRKGWVKGGQSTSNLGPRWTDPVTARRVPSKWTRKRGKQGEQGEQAKKNGATRGCAVYIQWAQID